MPDSLMIDFAKPIPLFPLAACALLPHATVPLHIFEPRYRQMTREVLDSTGLIAMAVLKSPRSKHQNQSNPPLREHVCVGYVVRHEKLHDGRYNILLQGVCRAKIVREVEHQPYRLALLEPTELGTPMEIDLGEERARLEALLSDPLLKQLAAVSTIHQWLSREVPTAALVDLVILSLCQDPEQRYAMLAEASVEARADWLERYLRQVRRTLEMAQRLGPAVSEDGFPLN